MQEKDGNVSREDSVQMAISTLDEKFKIHSWTVNQLINYCRDQKAGRENGVREDTNDTH